MSKPIPLGPWPLGVDNVHAASHRVFQVPGQGQPPARLRSAANVVLDDEGWPTARSGTATVAEFTAGLRLLSVGGALLVQDGAGLYLGEDLIADELEGPLIACEWPVGGARSWLTDGTVCFGLRDGVRVPWGLSRPGAVLIEEAETGTLRPATYLIGTTLLDGAPGSAYTQESGAAAPVAHVLDAEGGFILTQVVTETQATAVAFYVSRPNGSEPLLVSVKAITEDPDTHVRSAELEVTAPTQLGVYEMAMATVNAYPPPAGITVLGTLNAFMLAAVGNALYFSRAGQPHLWDLHRDVQVYPGDITTIVGLKAGAWVGTAAGLYWFAGDSPDNWSVTRACPDPILPSGALVPGGALPALQVDAPVALFASSMGLIAALPDGSIRRLTQDRYHLPTAAHVSIAYDEAARRFYLAVT